MRALHAVVGHGLAELGRLPHARRVRVRAIQRKAHEAGAQVAFDVPLGGAASAVSVNVTTTGHTADGYATAFGCGTNIPDTSTLNQRFGEDNSNGAIVTVGAGSAGCVFTSSATNVIVDLNGWWVPAS